MDRKLQNKVGGSRAASLDEVDVIRAINDAEMGRSITPSSDIDFLLTSDLAGSYCSNLDQIHFVLQSKEQDKLMEASVPSREPKDVLLDFVRKDVTGLPLVDALRTATPNDEPVHGHPILPTLFGGRPGTDGSHSRSVRGSVSTNNILEGMESLELPPLYPSSDIAKSGLSSMRASLDTLNHGMHPCPKCGRLPSFPEVTNPVKQAMSSAARLCPEDEKQWCKEDSLLTKLQGARARLAAYSTYDNIFLAVEEMEKEKQFYIAEREFLYKRVLELESKLKSATTRSSNLSTINGKQKLADSLRQFRSASNNKNENANGVSCTTQNSQTGPDLFHAVAQLYDDDKGQPCRLDFIVDSEAGKLSEVGGISEATAKGIIKPQVDTIDNCLQGYKSSFVNIVSQCFKAFLPYDTWKMGTGYAQRQVQNMGKEDEKYLMKVMQASMQAKKEVLEAFKLHSRHSGGTDAYPYFDLDDPSTSRIERSERALSTSHTTTKSYQAPPKDSASSKDSKVPFSPNSATASKDATLPRAVASPKDATLLRDAKPRKSAASIKNAASPKDESSVSAAPTTERPCTPSLPPPPQVATKETQTTMSGPVQKLKPEKKRKSVAVQTEEMNTPTNRSSPSHTEALEDTIKGDADQVTDKPMSWRSESPLQTSREDTPVTKISKGLTGLQPMFGSPEKGELRPMSVQGYCNTEALLAAKLEEGLSYSAALRALELDPVQFAHARRLSRSISSPIHQGPGYGVWNNNNLPSPKSQDGPRPRLGAATQRSRSPSPRAGARLKF
uniref:Uncharacterized protein n=1 Tax=Eutreptiella gymnastica TaxID=73025 RepID=A0A7S1ICS6_9EUGL|mmetsp:Transcript_147996/g.258633  ORF Transcript_147996/g.258633 Transcript_147996/m.258633 type:complete len:783 (+) Transcript_147996:208-2556(+)